VDMDAFFAAVEQRDHPELRGRPVIVGADPKGGRGRGVVSTCSYEARRFGVRSAMPISRAWELCPQGAFRPVDMERYLQASEQVMAAFRRFTDLVEPVSVDEAFLDVTGSERAFGPPEAIARAIKDAVRQDTALTASVGLASCKLVAKIASDLEKPDGLVIVPPGREAEFLAPLPVGRLWGVGPKTEESLQKVGVHTIGDLARVDPARLQARFGTHGHDLIQLARGIDDRPVVAESAEAKSLGQEHTFDQDTDERERLRRCLLDLADGVAARLRKHGLRGRTVTLKYRDHAFRTVTHAETLRLATDSGDTVFGAAWRLFGEVHRGARVRLLGIYVSGFGASQLDLFAEPTAAADRLRDAISERFGEGALLRASRLGRGEARHPESKGTTPGKGRKGGRDL
jgi:DNA polymerase IV